MENVRDIHLENTFKPISQNVKRKTRTKTIIKTRTRITAKTKQRILLFNICMSIMFFVFLQVGFTDMVNISSDNLIMENNNSKLSVEVNTLNDIIRPLNSEQRISKIAKSRLDMVYPSLDNIAEIENNNKGKIIDLAELSPGNKTSVTDNVLSAISNIFR